jgi:hypothetical protein
VRKGADEEDGVTISKETKKKTGARVPAGRTALCTRPLGARRRTAVLPGGRRRTGVLLGAALLSALLLAALFVTGCGIGTGPTQTLNVDEPLGSAAVTDVTVSMGAGKLSIEPGATGLVSGTIRYNVERWKPVVERTDSSVAIKQSTSKSLSGAASDVVNDWQLKLGSAPIRLAVTAGAYEGTYELGGLSLQKLSIKDGASKTKVTFSSPNPSQMDSLSYETGASSVTLAGLADANFKNLSFKGGAGSFILDFSGQLRTDSACSISAGVGSVHIIVPAGTAAKVTVKGKLTNVTQEGTWTATGKTYATPAVGGAQQGKVLSITVNMDLGSLTLTAS